MSAGKWRWQAALGLVALIALVSAGAWIGYVIAERSAVRALREGSAHRLAIYVASLQSELSRYDYLPATVALNPHVMDLMARPTRGQLRAHVNRYLETINAQAKASAVYVMDRHGLTLAASNWNQPVTFVDMNFSYRPYFQDALQGKAGHFYGIGTVSREPGYYFSHGIDAGGHIAGVVAVKVNLDKLDQAWSHAAEKILVADGNGVVFLSSEPGWKFRTLTRLSNETIGRLALTRQYSEAGMLEPIGLREKRQLPDGSAVVQQVREQPGRSAGELNVGSELLLHSHPVPGTDWKLVVLSDLQPARALARNTAIVTAFALGFLALLVLYFQQRRRIVRQSLANREALQRAHDELERKVQIRTEALSDANQLLQTQIGERKRAEEILKSTLEDLVQTGKMAVLGQMSAGITHELNQPLAALRTLSSNTIVFFNRGQQDEVESNLRMIAHLVDHMGKITAQLKKFARKSAIELHPVALGSVIADALFLLDQRIRSERVELRMNIAPQSLRALCDGNRLEQVLVNLLSNALDAAKDMPQRRLRIEAHCRGDWVTIEVHDNGMGIAAEVAPHLFEPFFTTKDQGVGLGLGLAISAGIMRDFGGTLRADASHLLDGAVFILQLKPVHEEVMA